MSLVKFRRLSELTWARVSARASSAPGCRLLYAGRHGEESKLDYVRTAQQVADGDLDGVTDALMDSGAENAAEAAGFELGLSRHEMDQSPLPGLVVLALHFLLTCVTPVHCSHVAEDALLTLVVVTF